MKQKVFSWKDRFEVWDEQGAPRWYVEGEFFTIGKRLHIYDVYQNECAYIRQRVPTFLPTYDLYIGGQLAVTMVKKFTFFKHEYKIEGTPLTLSGDFMAHDYALYDQGCTIMQLTKEWLSWGDSYHLNIMEPQHELLCLGVALGVDCSLFDNN